jgi:sugar/nucleoside kinase (ribokinase family)
LPAFGPEHVPPITARHVHVASYFLQPRLAAGLPTVLASARAVGASTSLDTNHDPAGTWQVAPRLLAECEFLFPNETEALALSTAATLPDALVALAAAGTTPVIKRGAEGAVALRDGRCVSAVGPRAMPVDTVGAGDSFDAGFLADWLDTGDLFRALAAACACGALSTRAGGGTAAQPYADEIAVAAARVQVTEMVTSRD